MSEKEFVIVDGVRYVKGTEPLSWEEQLKRMNAKTTEMPTQAIKTKSRKAKKEEPKAEEVVELTPEETLIDGES